MIKEANWQEERSEGAKARTEERYAEAERHFAAALESAEQRGEAAPVLLECINDLADIYLTLGKAEQAAALLERATGLEGAGHEIWFALSRAQAASGKGDQAVDSCQGALEMEPGSLVLWNELARLLWSQDRKSELQEVYEKTIALSPRTASDFYCRAYALMQLQRYPEAIEDFNKSLELSPGDVEAIESRAFCHLYSGEYARAILDYNEAITLDPTAYAYCCRGQALVQQGKYRQGIRDLTQAISMGGNDGSEFGTRAWAYMNIEEFDKAIEDINEALKHDQSNGELFAYRSKCHEAQGRTMEAAVGSSWMYDRTHSLMD